MKKLVNKKAETPLYENKAELAPLPNKSTTRARVIKAHDGLEVGREVITSPSVIEKMVNLGYWERI